MDNLGFALANSEDKLFEESDYEKATDILIALMSISKAANVIAADENKKWYICFPDGLRLIIEDWKYVGFYTQNPV